MLKPVMEAQERNMARHERALRCAIAPDGTFRLDDVSEGDWQLTVTIYAFPEGRYEQTGTLEIEKPEQGIPYLVIPIVVPIE